MNCLISICGFIAILTFSMAESVTSESDVIIHIHQGSIRGKTLISERSNRTFFGFMGIPYAKPPKGELRFKAPQLPVSWRGVRNATETGSNCPQLNRLGFYEGDEDCLFINVYTPKIPSKSVHSLMSVMVWIHGGDFIVGSGDRSMYGPDYLVDENVVVVTLNYRLGALGFLSLQNEKVPGNNGMKDQVFALKWVKQNIEKFGGNSDSITIFGESAGAASVHYHLMSPMSRGLFHRAISESGSALNPWSFQHPQIAIDTAIALGDEFGANSTDLKEVLAVLKKTSAKSLVEFVGTKILEPLSGAISGPTLDAMAASGDVFLPDMPINLINAGKFLKIPYITGVNSEEAILLVKVLRHFSRLLRPVVSIFEVTLPLFFGRRIPTVHEMALDISSKYFNNTKPLVLQYINALTDMLFINGVYCTAQKQALLSDAPVYTYEFSFNGTANVFKRVIYNANDLPGASHGDDIPYLFTVDALKVKIYSGSHEYKTSARIVKLWTNFAKTGNPTPKPDPLLGNIIWMPINKKEFPYLSIDTDLKLKNDLNGGNPVWWTKLFRKYIPDTSPCWPFQ